MIYDSTMLRNKITSIAEMENNITVTNLSSVFLKIALAILNNTLETIYTAIPQPINSIIIVIIEILKKTTPSTIINISFMSSLCPGYVQVIL